MITSPTSDILRKLQISLHGSLAIGTDRCGPLRIQMYLSSFGPNFCNHFCFVFLELFRRFLSKEWAPSGEHMEKRHCWPGVFAGLLDDVVTTLNFHQVRLGTELGAI